MAFQIYYGRLKAKFKFIKTEIEDVVIVRPTVFGATGLFYETYNYNEFRRRG